MNRVQSVAERVSGRARAASPALPTVREVWGKGNGDQRDLRNALGRFATGVTVMTIDTAEGPFGMTVNSFAAVSLEPALILWSVARSSPRCQAFCEAPSFAVNILSDEQEDLALAFARDPFAFDNGGWRRGAHGLPLLDGCVATLQCRRHAVHDGGDHRILLGEIEQASISEHAPLLFAGGQFRALA